MPNYPASDPALPDITDASPWDQHAEDHEAERNEINAIGADLVAARGAEPTVAAKVAALEAAISGGGAPLSDTNPAALGAVDPGVAIEASRSDHVHPMPGATDVGADPAGTATAAAAGAEANANAYTDAAVGAEATARGNADTAHAAIVDGTAHGINALIAAEAGARDAAIAAAVANLLDSAPGALDTLNELATALGDDPNFAATVTASLATKQGQDATLDAIAGLATQADRGIYFTALDVAAVYILTAFGRTLAGAADAAAARTSLELGSAALSAASAFDTSGSAAAAQAAAQAYTDALAATLGTASTRNVPASGDAAPTEVVLGSDSRLGAGGITDVVANGGAPSVETVLEFLDSASVTFDATNVPGDRTQVNAIAQLSRFGDVSTDGHSFTQLVGSQRSLQPYTFPRILAALVGAEGKYLFGRSGSVIAHCQDTIPSLGSTGWGALLRIWHPTHRFGEVNEQDKARQDSGAWPHLGVGMWGENEAGASNQNGFGGFRIPIAELRAPFRDGYRALISLRRAARLYPPENAAWVHVGLVSTNLSHSLRGTFRQFTANGQTATYTIPADAREGDILCLAFLGGANGYAELSANVAIGASSFTTNDYIRISTFPTSYPFDVTIGTETVTVTGRSGGTYLNVFAISGTFAQAHTAGDAVRRAANHRVTLSGTAGLTDVIVLAARGAYGGPQIVTKRVAITAAMIGKTVIVTNSQFAASPVGQGIIGAWLEDPIPPPYLLCETHRQGYNTPFVDDNVSASKLLLNADIATVASEFTNAAVVPLETIMAARYAFKIKAGSSLNGTDAAGTPRTITIIPDSMTQYRLRVGGTLRSASEDLIVTGITVNASDLTVDLLRAQNGTASVARVAGNDLFNREPMGDDGLHPSIVGHRDIAAAIISTAATLPQTDDQRAITGAEQVGTPRYRNPSGAYPLDGFWYRPPGERSTQGTLLVNSEYTYAHRIHQAIHLTHLAVSFTACSVNRDYLIILRNMLEGPGTILAQAAVSAIGANGAQTLTGAVDRLLKPGLYFWGLMSLTANTGATARTVKSIDTFPMSVDTSVEPAHAGGSNAQGIWGYRIDHGSPTPLSPPGPSNLAALVQDSSGVPMIQYRGYVIGRD